MRVCFWLMHLLVSVEELLFFSIVRAWGMAETVGRYASWSSLVFGADMTVF